MPKRDCPQSARRHARAVRARREQSLALRADALYPTACRGGGLSALALDSAAARWLLVGRGTGELLLRDLELPPGRSQVAARRGGHAHAVKSLAWLARDAGLFVSGSRDQTVGVWDAAAFAPVCKVPLGSPINAVALSPVPGGATANLAACATKGPVVRLCDLGSGSAARVLEGHRGSDVLCCAWAPTSEFLLATGGSDKTLRLWDLRAGGCLALLDQHNARHDRPTDPQNTAHDGAVLGLCFTGGHDLLSSGSDGRVRRWTPEGAPRARRETLLCNSFVNYSAHDLRVQLASTGVMAAGENTLFHACGAHGSSLASFDLSTGRALPGAQRMTEAGHLMRITAMAFRDSFQELYTASLDGMLLRWTSSYPVVEEDEGEEAGGHESNDDDWLSPAEDGLTLRN